MVFKDGDFRLFRIGATGSEVSGDGSSMSSNDESVDRDQRMLKELLLQRDRRCVVTGKSYPECLHASHVIPVAGSWHRNPQALQRVLEAVTTNGMENGRLLDASWMPLSMRRSTISNSPSFPPPLAAPTKFLLWERTLMCTNTMVHKSEYRRGSTVPKEHNGRTTSHIPTS
ncbi:hypothetical protein M427DRAFT_51928 [Gonapodya prolifera JEL478]|uniref:Uncharacterized protein n=1 Tax=Gonapodya prolifera (strain JEL478) TaxID=1344416 RepID=A0A139AWX3_GONPJ|nr:hypothetical protein M427DRAFT_51928 [Gonapodya prolifera JEL478]|eukprot:KXS20975.1 hypothetical protein M427DRAFT_51928 [Gonapodya prolifera JEL478]